jgi:hypothetical protein
MAFPLIDAFSVLIGAFVVPKILKTGATAAEVAAVESLKAIKAHVVSLGAAPGCRAAYDKLLADIDAKLPV